MLKAPRMVVLAGLFHDVGKLWQRAGEKGRHAQHSGRFVVRWSKLFRGLQVDELVAAVENHHGKSRTTAERIVKLADWLASGERETLPGLEQGKPYETPLASVFALVDHRCPSPSDAHAWGYRAVALRIGKMGESPIFPQKGVRNSPADYEELVRGLEHDLMLLQEGTFARPLGDVDALALLRKYCSLVPAATPWEEDEENRTLPDISLYDHSKVTAAVAECLERVDSELLGRLEDARGHWTDVQEPIAMLIRGDVSGIQNYVYRIARPEAEDFRGTARRLRARSFWLQLFTEVVADWLRRELELSAANVLFCGGGRFDILAPIDGETRQKLEGTLRNLDEWLLQSHYGELGLATASVPLSPAEFMDMGKAFDALEDLLAQRKLKRWSSEALAGKVETGHEFCAACGAVEVERRGDICKQCDEHSKIGQKLPKTRFLVWRYGESSHLKEGLPEGPLVDFSKGFGVSVGLLGHEDLPSALRNLAGREEVVVQSLNDADWGKDLLGSGVHFSFRFTANVSPVCQKYFPSSPVHGGEPIQRGDVLDFEELAFLSNGAQLLGVLKADVDYLGSLFTYGVKPKRTISRIVSISGMLDLFFSGWISELAQGMWRQRRQDNSQVVDSKAEALREAVSSPFQVVYSGGDDLFVLGPWNYLIDFAGQLREDFSRFCCSNPNLSLSAGFVLVKPHYPIQRFAAKVSGALGKAKGYVYSPYGSTGPPCLGKNLTMVFGRPVSWTGGPCPLEELVAFGKELAEGVQDGVLPRSLLHFLLQLGDQFVRWGQDGVTMDVRWIPKFYYVLSRRLNVDVIADSGLLEKVPRYFRCLRVPVTYAILRTRRTE